MIVQDIKIKSLEAVTKSILLWYSLNSQSERMGQILAAILFFVLMDLILHELI